MYVCADTNFSSPAYVGLIGLLFAASTFTGYDTAAHVAEETTQSHKSSKDYTFDNHAVYTYIHIQYSTVSGKNAKSIFQSYIIPYVDVGDAVNTYISEFFHV